MNVIKLLDKSETMTLLTSKAVTHWSLVKFCFNIPLVLTSSAMCIINSITDNAEDMKIPNIIVNTKSVLIMSLNNSIKTPEKYELFKKLSQQFMTLSQEVESCDNMDKEKYNMFLLKYDNLAQDCLFEEIPHTYKQEVIKSFGNRFLPIQLNGTIGNNRPPSFKGEIVISENNNVMV